MASREAQVMDAAFAAIGASTATDLVTGVTYTKPAGLTAYRTRRSPFGEEDLPAVAMRRVQEDTTRVAGGHKDRRAFLFGVDCYAVASSDGEAAEDALDVVRSWVIQAISNVAALQGGTGSLAVSTREVLTKWEESDTNALYLRATVGFSADIITAAGNPDAA
jgi:hypothetical protein